MGPYTPDPVSIAGKALDVGERTQLLVVGAGPAGIAAALEAAGHGVAVVLVDENPIPAESMGEDVPLLFGDGASGAVRNRTAMMEAVLAGNPGIEAAFDAGVDVRLETAAWGVFANGGSVGWLPGPVAGLADAERSWMIACDHVIVAAGRRDMGLAFPGWDLPGVMGATAAHRLATLYGAFDRRRAVVLGTTADALATACLLRDRGVEIAAIVERASAPVGPDDLLGSLVAGGIPMLCGHVLARAEGGVGGVEAAVAVRVGPDGRHVAGSERSLACDTIVLGIAAVPAIELLEASAAERCSRATGAATCRRWARRSAAPSRGSTPRVTAPASGRPSRWMSASPPPRGGAPRATSRCGSASPNRMQRSPPTLRWQTPSMPRPIGSNGSGPAWWKPPASPTSAAARRSRPGRSWRCGRRAT